MLIAVKKTNFHNIFIPFCVHEGYFCFIIPIYFIEFESFKCYAVYGPRFVLKSGYFLNVFHHNHI